MMEGYPLNRVAFELGAFQVHWYGLIIGCGIALGFYLATKESQRLGLEKDTFADLLIWAIPIAILCARVYYVLFQWEYYSQHPADIIKIWEGGIAIHGALIGAVATTIAFSMAKNISFWKLADIAAPSIILGQAIGRWGNFMNQEAHGGEVTRSFLEGLHLPDFIINQMYIEGVYYHPTFLYESLWNLLGFALLIALRKVNLRRGEMFLTYVIWYSIGRFFIEGLRTDSLMLGALRMAQVISIGLVVAAVVIWIVRRKMNTKQVRYNSMEN
ncbi:prolipoprotein diacylglyceryl transferase [Bacillus sp. FJAT-42315]|uniref:prolipoprotein diacylglyceryl transferase n=1 Tax=Bacillus sp. FJAT-42315 TaxID=2014077 RepID=UPI003FA449B3